MNPRTTRAAIEAHYLPLIAQARTAAESRRDEAWLDVPHPICGLAVRALTLADFLALRAAGNAHFTAAATPPAEPLAAARFWSAHHAQLLWWLCPAYRPGASAERERWILDRIAPLPFEKLHAEVMAYLAATFADCPAPVQAEGASAAPASLGASFAACWVHDFSAAYGWPPAVILGLPLAQIFQLLHLQRHDALLKTGRTPAPSGDEADRLAAAAFSEIAALADPSL